MKAHWVVGFAVGIVVFVLALGAFVAVGAPSAPTAQISGTLNPAVAQTFQVTLLTQAYATVVPNSIVNLGTAFVYTATYWNIQNQSVILAQNQHVASAVLTSNGALYTLGTTITLTVPQLCVAAQCAGFVDNLTITTYAQIPTYPATWVSSVSVIQFSNVPAYQHVPALAAPSPATWLEEFLLPILLALTTVFLTAYFIRHNVYFGWTGLVSAILLVVAAALLVL